MNFKELRLIPLSLILIAILASATTPNLCGQGIGMDSLEFSCSELTNSLFTSDNRWQGADGAASVDLGNNRILWLFSDTFIDKRGTGRRSKSRMIRNSIGIQTGHVSDSSKMEFYHGGTSKRPAAFFERMDEGWFWTGHGAMIEGRLVVFLINENKSREGFGFKATGWSMVVVENPEVEPKNWKISYFEGEGPESLIVGSSAVVIERPYLYAFAVKEPDTHEVYLARFDLDSLLTGNFQSSVWWNGQNWIPASYRSDLAVLFTGQTEFSVHFEPQFGKFIQIQTIGFGDASLSYRISDHLTGPWSEPVIFFKPELEDKQEFVYTANAHPALSETGLIVTYNVNNFDFGKLVANEKIYYPKMIRLLFGK